tara:strand:- start:3319 stop:4335 length:1017 start_codon:yes stop_codon:yes gene_type:complete
MYGRKIVNKLNLLGLVDDYDIFQHYCSNFRTVNIKFSSEFRNDSNPSCIIGKYGERLFYKDFAEPDSYDSIAYVMRKFSIGYGLALNTINRDFEMGLVYTCSISQLPISNSVSGVLHNVDISKFSSAPTVIKIRARQWEAKDGKYWKDKYGIEQRTLVKYQVVPVTQYWVSGRKGHHMVTTRYHAYAYFGGTTGDGREQWKIYQPYDRDGGKWMSNVPGTCLQGFDQLPISDDVLIITKSLKDVMVIDELNLSAIAPHGENFAIADELMVELKLRFDEVVILYDNDEAGIIAANKLAQEYGLRCIFLPTGTKDVSDFVESYDYNALEEVLQELLEDGK